MRHNEAGGSYSIERDPAVSVTAASLFADADLLWERVQNMKWAKMRCSTIVVSVTRDWPGWHRYGQLWWRTVATQDCNPEKGTRDEWTNLRLNWISAPDAC